MIKVIKRSEAPRLTATFNCAGCRSTLSADRDDGRMGGDQNRGIIIRIVCPVCDSENRLSASLFKEEG